jgi:hypothetical protein
MQKYNGLIINALRFLRTPRGGAETVKIADEKLRIPTNIALLFK